MKPKKTNRIKEYFAQWTTFEKLWLMIFTCINIYLFFAWHDTWVGFVASLTGMLCVVLTAKARVSSFYFGLVNILTYSYVAFQSKYYGDAMLNMLFFLPMTFPGIYYWRKNSKKVESDKKVIIRSLPLGKKVLWFLISILAIVDYSLRFAGEEKVRASNNETLKKMYQERGIDFYTISGGYNERFQRARALVENLFVKK